MALHPFRVAIRCDRAFHRRMMIGLHAVDTINLVRPDHLSTQQVDPPMADPRERRRHLEQAVALLALGRGRDRREFGRLPPLDVADARDELDRLARRVADQPVRRLEPDVMAVAVLLAIAADRVVGARQQRLGDFDDSRPVVGVDGSDGRAAQHLIGSIAEQCFAGGRHVAANPVEPDADDHVVRMVGEQPVELLVLGDPRRRAVGCRARAQHGRDRPRDDEE